MAELGLQAQAGLEQEGNCMSLPAGISHFVQRKCIQDSFFTLEQEQAGPLCAQPLWNLAP